MNGRIYRSCRNFIRQIGTLFLVRTRVSIVSSKSKSEFIMMNYWCFCFVVYPPWNASKLHYLRRSVGRNNRSNISNEASCQDNVLSSDLFPLPSYSTCNIAKQSSLEHPRRGLITLGSRFWRNMLNQINWPRREKKEERKSFNGFAVEMKKGSRRKEFDGSHWRSVIIILLTD